METNDALAVAKRHVRPGLVDERLERDANFRVWVLFKLLDEALGVNRSASPSLCSRVEPGLRNEERQDVYCIKLIASRRVADSFCDV